MIEIITAINKVLYAFFGVCAVFGTGNATQVNTITAAVNTALINYGLLTVDSTAGSNLIAVFLLAPELLKLIRKYFNKEEKA